MKSECPTTFSTRGITFSCHFRLLDQYPSQYEDLFGNCYLVASAIKPIGQDESRAQTKTTVPTQNRLAFQCQRSGSGPLTIHRQTPIPSSRGSGCTLCHMRLPTRFQDFRCHLVFPPKPRRDLHTDLLKSRDFSSADQCLILAPAAPDIARRNIVAGSQKRASCVRLRAADQS